MPYYTQPDHIPTVLEGLNHQTVEQLKVLASLLPAGNIPTRKAELVSYLQQRLQGKSLRCLWEQCDHTQQAVISEVVHSADDQYQQGRFVSKYGKKPIWSPGERYSSNYKPAI